MVEFMPEIQTDRGRLRFFSVSEARLGRNEDGVAVLDSHITRFAVDDGGNVRIAEEGEVSAFISRLLSPWKAGEHD